MADHIVERNREEVEESTRENMLTDVEAQIYEQDKLLDQLGSTVSNLKNQANTISSEIDDQRTKLMELEDDIEEVNSRLTKTKQKIKQIKKELGTCFSDSCRSISCLIGLVIVFFVVIPFLIYVI